jgi:hypothetical protein
MAASDLHGSAVHHRVRFISQAGDLAREARRVEHARTICSCVVSAAQDKHLFIQKDSPTLLKPADG